MITRCAMCLCSSQVAEFEVFSFCGKTFSPPHLLLVCCFRDKQERQTVKDRKVCMFSINGVKTHPAYMWELLGSHDSGEAGALRSAASSRISLADGHEHCTSCQDHTIVMHRGPEKTVLR